MTSGRAIEGHASQATWRGLQLGQAQWEIKPIRLLRGEFNARVETQGPLNLSGSVLADSQGRIFSDDLRGSMPASWIDLQATMPFVLLDGRIEWEFRHMDIRQGEIPRLEGEFIWKDAGLKGLAKAEMGTIQIQLQQQQGSQLANLTSLEPGEITVAGTLSSDGENYEMDLAVEVDPSRQDIYELLAQYGEARGRTVILRQSGKLFPQ